jgi:hypothetical protein
MLLTAYMAWPNNESKRDSFAATHVARSVYGESSQARKAANKRNAVRSTGPLTASGKQRASRNALKHGLSTSIRHRPDISNKIEALAVAIAGANSIPRRLQAARGVAEAELELRRLQEFRLALIEVEASRLAAAVDEATEDKPRTRLRWFCSPHHQGCANRILDDWPRRPSGMCSSGK